MRAFCSGGGGQTLVANLGVEDVSPQCHPELDSGSIQHGELPLTLDRFRNKFGMTVKSIVCMSAFTMAEILLSLTIIGVVAAITLPSLTGNINERTWNTQRKALYARFSQAMPLMDALNGYGTITEETSSGAGDAVDTAAETFITAGLAKVLKINNICDNEHLEDCGIASSITTLGGSRIDLPKTMEELNDNMVSRTIIEQVHNSYSVYNTKAAAFETSNGESIVVYYNPTCTGSFNETPYALGDINSAGGIYIQQRICANFIYDLNGNKGPNTVGKDVGFMTAMYPFDVQMYAPYPATKPLTVTSDYAAACSNYDSEYRLPKADELASMFVNKKLIDAAAYQSTQYISSDKTIHPNGNTVNIMQSLITGFRDDGGNHGIWCVKR